MSTKYSRWMSKGTPEIVRDDDNSERLKIYRGLEVPERSIVSEGDNRERVQGIIDLKHPGIDWTPIRAFADDVIVVGKIE